MVQAEHIFSLNNMWASLLNFLGLNSHDASHLFNGNTIFDESLLTNYAMFQKLFQKTESPILDSLTEEHLELICCTCFLMIKSQLRDQLPGGKYFAPNNETRPELQNSPTTNMCDQKLTQKPTLSDIAVCGVIMFNNNKSWKRLNLKKRLHCKNSLIKKNI